MKCFLSLLVFAGIYISVRAQDPVFSQFYANKPLLNPALTALDEGTAFTVNYRNLWHKTPGGFQTFSAAAETQWARCSRGRRHAPFFNFGFGLVALHDQEGQGRLVTDEAHVAASAFHLFKENGAIHVGVSVGGGQKSLDWSRLTFADQLDALDGKILDQTTAPVAFGTRSYSDLGGGLALRFGHEFGIGEAFQSFGLSARHALKRVESINQDGGAVLPMIFTVHYGCNLPVWVDSKVSEKFFLYWSPQVQFIRQGRFSTFGVGMYGSYRGFMSGIFFRSSNFQEVHRHAHVLMFTGGIDLPSKSGKTLFRFDYSYDLSLNKLASYTGGAHEISLKINLFEFAPGGCGSGRRAGSGNKIKCPSPIGRLSQRE